MSQEPRAGREPNSEETQVINAGAAQNAGAEPVAFAAAEQGVEQTRALSTQGLDAEQQAREEAARARLLERQERERRLGTVTPPADEVTVKPPTKSVNDKFIGSLGLFLLRVITAMIVGVRGLQIVLDNPGTADKLAEVGVPSAQAVAWGVGVGLLAVAVLLVFGFITRFAGFLVATVAILVLVFFRWGEFNIFMEGVGGFAGDLELLLAGVGVLLMLLGSGGWAIDAGVRHRRAQRKAYYN